MTHLQSHSPEPKKISNLNIKPQIGFAHLLYYEFGVAIRYLRARKKDGFISLIAWFSFLGIAIGVATLIIVLSVMNGFRQDLLDRILGFSGHITVSAYDGLIDDGGAFKERLLQFKQVRHARLVIDGHAIATANGQSRGVLIRAIEHDELTHQALQKTDATRQNERAMPGIEITPSALQDFQNNQGVLIGTHLHRILGLRSSETITLIHPQGTQTAFGTVPLINGYKPIGAFKVGMYQYDSSVILMPMMLARDFFSINPNAVHGVELFIDQPDDVDDLSLEIKKAVGDDYFVNSWKRSNQSLVGALKVERNVMFVILTLIILVGAFNILASLVMLVHEKESAIAILRSCGVMRASILRIFLMCGSMIGLIGTLLGILIGYSFSNNIHAIQHFIEGLSGQELFQEEIYFLSTLPSTILIHDVIFVSLIAFVLSVLSALYPAVRATRLQPIEILNHG
ncbi:MAG: lipoprotein-releasing ABC transporter permease subunit [Pseudomonadota bacterium]